MGQKGTVPMPVWKLKVWFVFENCQSLAVVYKDCARPCMVTLPVISAFSWLRQEEHMHARMHAPREREGTNRLGLSHPGDGQHLSES